MKARVKATGRIIEVMNVMGKDGGGIWEDMSDVSTNPTKYHNYELDFIDLPKDLQHNDHDYWERLKHQYAGMAMQGILAEDWCTDDQVKMCVEKAVKIAAALVEKLKEESNGN